MPDASDVHARVVVPAAPAEVFGFLADLENHWLVADRFVDVLDLDGPPGARSGGRVRIRGPLGINRTATTRVELVDPVHAMGGSAQIGSTTRADVRWTLDEHGAATAVTLAARLVRSGPLDRALWAIGGRAWMRRRFAGTLTALARRFDAPG